MPYSDKRICPKIHEDASLAAGPCSYCVSVRGGWFVCPSVPLSHFHKNQLLIPCFSLSQIQNSTETAIQMMLLTNQEIVTQLLPQLTNALSSIHLQI